MRHAMNMPTVALLSGLLLGTGPVELSLAQSEVSLGTAFTYQGQLKQAGAPITGTADLEFKLYDAEAAGSQVGPTLSIPGVILTNGLFALQLDFGQQAFNGNARWLEIRVGSTTLTPRQMLTPTPYALALPGLRTVQNTTSPNILGGWTGNSITAGVVGASIGGGGEPERSGAPRPNKVTDNYGSVGGGSANTSGDNDAVLNDAEHATVGGGYYNTASGALSTVGGGWYNFASAERATVAGGWNNKASAHAATVAGGRDNVASGSRSVVAGGASNRAQGDGSLAAGYRAKADHAGTFVWADSSEADFTSTANNQFLIRASGGVGIGNPAPQAKLDVGVASDATMGHVAGASYGAYGKHNSTGSYGAMGASSFGVAGYHGPSTCYGYLGYSGKGVYGVGPGASDVGVTGDAYTGKGVYGSASGDSGTGVHGEATNLSSAPTAVGVRGDHKLTGNTGTLGASTTGAYGASANGIGVYGQTTTGSAAVYGVHNNGNSGSLGTGTHGVYSNGHAHVEGNLTWKAKKSYVSLGWLNLQENSWTLPLPHGATITKFTFFYYDADPGNDKAANVWRVTLSNGQLAGVANVDSSGSAGSGSASTATIYNGVVDNSQYVYAVAVTGGDTTNFLRPVGFVIEYTTTSP